MYSRLIQSRAVRAWADSWTNDWFLSRSASCSHLWVFLRGLQAERKLVGLLLHRSRWEWSSGAHTGILQHDRWDHCRPRVVTFYSIQHHPRTQRKLRVKSALAYRLACIDPEPAAVEATSWGFLNACSLCVKHRFHLSFVSNLLVLYVYAACCLLLPRSLIRGKSFHGVFVNDASINPLKPVRAARSVLRNYF